ncbi:MAG: ABC transporter substrate-binding protein [Candidatus Dormibacteraeota bacterium]|nr:ABC transporter substrate-binding protein [Candidatus Dormibacteraeota bacterium]
MLGPDRGFTVTIAAAIAGTALISGVMVAGMYQPGSPSTQHVQTVGATGGSGGTTAQPGQSSGGGGGHGATGGVPSTSNLTRTACQNGVVHLGSIITQTGPGRSITMAHALIAWEKSVNAAGGINGCKVDIDGGSILDDQGNPDLGASQYRTLWEDQKVFAFVGECAPLTDEQMVGYVQQNNVPLVGECQSAPSAYQPPGNPSQCWCVWVGGPTPTQNGQLGAELMEHVQSWPASNGQIALVCLDDPTTIQDCNGAAAQYGSGALWNGGPQMEQIYDNNYAQLIAQWQSSGISHVHLVLDPGSLDRFLKAASDASYTPQMFNNLVIDSDTAGSKGYPNANGMYIGTPWTPLDQNTPGMQRLEQAMSTYYPGDRVDLYAQTAWVSCLIMEHALELMGKNVSQANLLSTLDGIHGWDTGLGPVENYSPGNHIGPLESALMQLQGAGTDSWRLATVHQAING